MLACRAAGATRRQHASFFSFNLALHAGVSGAHICELVSTEIAMNGYVPPWCMVVDGLAPLSPSVFMLAVVHGGRWFGPPLPEPWQTGSLTKASLSVLEWFFTGIA